MLCGYKYEEIYFLFKKYAKKIKYIDYKNIIKIIYGIIIKRRIIINGLNSGINIEKVMIKASKEKNIEKIKEIRLPLLIPSVDLHTGEIYFFCSKLNRAKVSDNITYIDDINIARAVRASCSYPVIFSPCKYKNTELIDGGIRENIPWKETKKMGADKVISVVFEKEFNNRCCNNILDVVSNSMDILTHEISSYEIEGADYLLKIKTSEISLLDMTKIDYLYELGYKITKNNLYNIL